MRVDIAFESEDDPYEAPCFADAAGAAAEWFTTHLGAGARAHR